MPNEEQRTPITFERRMDALAAALEAEAREREKSRADFDARMEASDRRMEASDRRMEAFDRRMNALSANLEAFNASMEALKRRHDALTMNMELAWRDIEAGRVERDKDAIAIHRLANIAEAPDRRLSDPEGPNQA